MWGEPRHVRQDGGRQAHAKPIRIYGRVLWDVRAIDAAFDALDGGRQRPIINGPKWRCSPIGRLP